MCFYWGKFNAEMVVAKLAAMTCLSREDSDFQMFDACKNVSSNDA